MAEVRQLFSQNTIGPGLHLDIYMIYDDVTHIVSRFEWDNPGPATTLTITVNGFPFLRQVPPGPGQYVLGTGIQLVESPKYPGHYNFPYNISIAPG